MEVVHAVKARLNKITPFLPPDIKTVIIRDQSRFIEHSIDEVKFHLLLSAVLVSLTILLFIREQIQGSVIRRKLTGDRFSSKQHRLPPEQAVLDTVCEFLKLPRDRFDEASEFAAFGMDSIKALHVAERLQKRLGVAVDPAMFYEFPTVAALAGALADRTAGRSAGGRT